MTNESPKVFISYAHDDNDHKQKVLDFANKLNSDGIDCWIDRYVEGSSPDNGWPAWMDEKIRLSDFVLVVASQKYLDRWEGRENAGVGKGGKFESILIVQELFDKDSKNTKYYSVLISEKTKNLIISPLRPWNYYDMTKSDGYDGLYRLLTGQIVNVKPPVGKMRNLDSPTAQVATEIARFAIDQPLEQFLETIPEIAKFTDNMNPSMKILQAFFALPVSTRFSIATELKLLESGESISEANRDEMSGKFLLRAKERNLLFALWSKLFDESIDPNPFKK